MSNHSACGHTIKFTTFNIMNNTKNAFTGTFIGCQWNNPVKRYMFSLDLKFPIVSLFPKLLATMHQNVGHTPLKDLSLKVEILLNRTSIRVLKNTVSNSFSITKRR